ncbi:hypothetical protein CPB83DRAFT_846869 [Crepidotus variabilis]|uniref:F-box domain-containing protein n=1 Tax=Crepidotus variabilis TaxID=179855 RepID=A0A9P6ENL0_9AGAR|nr:hypothetical protein CPB83DRAFT_846869 [Crepidotus variabilis]
MLIYAIPTFAPLHCVMALSCSTNPSNWPGTWHGSRTAYFYRPRGVLHRAQGLAAPQNPSESKRKYEISRQQRRASNASTVESKSCDNAQSSGSVLSSFATTCLEVLLRRANDSDASLEGILDLPYDIVLEVCFALVYDIPMFSYPVGRPQIFGHLTPLDLLNISRTSHQLRNTLLDRRVRCVWQASFGNIPRLPPCPSDLNEVQYAALAFDDWCSFCLAPVVDQISWLCRQRPCPKCIKEQFIPQTELADWLPKDFCLDSPETLFPYLRRRGQRHYLRSTLKVYIDELNCLPGENREKSLSDWQERRKVVQAGKQTHAVNSDTWLIQWTAAQRSLSATSYLTEIGLVIALLFSLMYLWSEQLFPKPN